MAQVKAASSAARLARVAAAEAARALGHRARSADAEGGGGGGYRNATFISTIPAQFHKNNKLEKNHVCGLFAKLVSQICHTKRYND